MPYDDSYKVVDKDAGMQHDTNLDYLLQRDELAQQIFNHDQLRWDATADPITEEMNDDPLKSMVVGELHWTRFQEKDQSADDKTRANEAAQQAAAAKMPQMGG